MCVGGGLRTGPVSMTYSLHPQPCTHTHPAPHAHRHMHAHHTHTSPLDTHPCMHSTHTHTHMKTVRYCIKLCVCILFYYIIIVFAWNKLQLLAVRCYRQKQADVHSVSFCFSANKILSLGPLLPFPFILFSSSSVSFGKYVMVF